ncbi:hypothetical protein wTpre_323 [Wolbachia endosymbiont of Trichogramma pretiosum]|nr:hypothetical protein wTpre_323 [Wolbachia endosymbiont of Trichogramma pretiosum]
MILQGMVIAFSMPCLVKVVLMYIKLIKFKQCVKSGADFQTSLNR